MNLKKAQEICESQEKQLDNSKRMNTQTVVQEYVYVGAKAYLEAYKHFKPLVEALEKIKNRECLGGIHCTCYLGDNGNTCVFIIAEEALENHKRLMGEGKEGEK